MVVARTRQTYVMARTSTAMAPVTRGSYRERDVRLIRLCGSYGLPLARSPFQQPQDGPHVFQRFN